MQPAPQKQPKDLNAPKPAREPYTDCGIVVGRVPTGPTDSKRWEVTFLSRDASGQLKTERKIVSKSTALGMIGELGERLKNSILWNKTGRP